VLPVPRQADNSGSRVRANTSTRRLATGKLTSGASVPLSGLGKGERPRRQPATHLWGEGKRGKGCTRFLRYARCAAPAAHDWKQATTKPSTICSERTSGAVASTGGYLTRVEAAPPGPLARARGCASPLAPSPRGLAPLTGEVPPGPRRRSVLRDVPRRS
jgi:hypothetical protein